MQVPKKPVVCKGEYTEKPVLVNLVEVYPFVHLLLRLSVRVVHPLADPEDIRERLQHDLDPVIDGGHCGTQPTTVIDLSSGSPELVRAGAGDLARFGLE